MIDRPSQISIRIADGASQLPRFAWYVGHSLALRWLSDNTQRKDGKKPQPRAYTNLPVPDRGRLYADMAILFRQDLANIEAGLYPLPADHDGSLLTLIERSRLFFADLPEIHRRRENRAHHEVRSEPVRGKRPRYYLQNFHFQTGGWMTDDLRRVMTRRSRCSSTAQPTRRADRLCRNCTKPLPEEISADCDFSTSAAGPGAFSIFSNRHGHAFRPSALICLNRMSDMPNAT